MQDRLRSSIEAAADILKAFGATEVYVFGSAAHGSLRADSDVDLAVSGLPPAVFFRVASKAADALDRPADLVDLDDESVVKYLWSSGELVRVQTDGSHRPLPANAVGRSPHLWGLFAIKQPPVEERRCENSGNDRSRWSRL